MVAPPVPETPLSPFQTLLPFLPRLKEGPGAVKTMLVLHEIGGMVGKLVGDRDFKLIETADTYNIFMYIPLNMCIYIYFFFPSSG